MSNLKALRNRVKSIKSTQKITKAMKMVSAAKLYRAKEASLYTKKFKEKVKEILLASKAGVSLGDCDEYTKSLLFGLDKPATDIAIIISSDRGLCGNYNSSLLKLVRKNLSSDFSTKLIILGKKIEEYLLKDYPKNILFSDCYNSDPSYLSERVIEVLNSEYEKNSSLNVTIFYTEFINILQKNPITKKIWPVENLSTENLDSNFSTVEFEGENLLNSVLKLYLKTNLISALLDSKASEEAARTTAMDNATKNAGDMIDSLTLLVNRTRQANITRELIEVISGVEAS